MTIKYDPELPLTGYRFSPTDFELIEHYLRRRINNEPLPSDHVREINVYASTPDEIADTWQIKDGEIGYFITSRQRKYSRGNRPNRTVGDGHWKAMSEAKIYEDVRDIVVGSIRTLDYYNGKHKSKWIMKEYSLVSPHQPFENTNKWDEIVLCKIYETPRKSKNKDSHQDFQDSQLNVIRKNSSEPSSSETPDVGRSSKIRKISSDSCLPRHSIQHQQQNNASSSMVAATAEAEGVQLQSSAAPVYGISVPSSQEDYGLQYFQSPMPLTMAMPMSMPQEMQMPIAMQMPQEMQMQMQMQMPQEMQMLDARQGKLHQLVSLDQTNENNQMQLNNSQQFNQIRPQMPLDSTKDSTSTSEQINQISSLCDVDCDNFWDFDINQLEGFAEIDEILPMSIPMPQETQITDAQQDKFHQICSLDQTNGNNEIQVNDTQQLHQILPQVPVDPMEDSVSWSERHNQISRLDNVDWNNFLNFNTNLVEGLAKNDKNIAYKIPGTC